MEGITVFFIIGSIITTSLVLGIIIYFLKKGKIRDEFDKAVKRGIMIKNYMPHFTHGFAYGFESDIIHTKSGRMIATFFPIQNEGEIRKETLVVDNGCRIAIAKGEFDRNLTSVTYLPHDMSKYNKINQTEAKQLGKNFKPVNVEDLTEMTIRNKIENNLFAGMREGDKAQKYLIDTINKGELSKIAIDNLKDLKDTIDSMIQKKEEPEHKSRR